MSDSYKPLFDNTRQKLRLNPDKTRAEISVQSRQVGGFRSEVKIRDFTITIDQPENFGGTNLGPKPSEYVLAALAACQEVTYRLFADGMGIPLHGVTVKLTGVSDLRGFLALDDSIRPGFQEIHGEVILDSTASPEQLAELKEKVDKHCPVLDDLRTPLKVDLTLRNKQ